MKILVTAGPTREPIDAVRFLSNRASGAFGYAVAEQAAARGHQVVLLTGPAALPPPRHLRVEEFETCRQLQQRMAKWWPWCDAVVMTAAVSDYRAQRRISGKIGRSGRLRLELVATPDVIGSFAKRKGGRKLIGCAVESGLALQRARQKLIRKRLDAIVVTLVGRGQESPFGAGAMKAAIVGPDGVMWPMRRRAKTLVAGRLLDTLESL